MTTRIRSLIPGLVLGVILLTPMTGEAQIRQQDQDRMRDRIHQMDQQIQRMDRIRDRIHQLDQKLAQQMERVQQQARQRDQQHAEQQQRLQDQGQRQQADRVRAQQRVREQDQLRQHQELREMSWAITDMAQFTRRNMERNRAMLNNGVFAGDPQMQRELEQLEANWRAMGDELEKGLRSLEQLQQRLGAVAIANW
jgi:hypothetical protein